MRLTETEINHIITALTPFLAQQNAELRLYGSRVNDSLRGGDIDLLLIVESLEETASLKIKKHHILAEIKNLIGDQRIDLKIIAREEINDDPFLAIIIPSSVILHRWQKD